MKRPLLLLLALLFVLHADAQLITGYPGKMIKTGKAFRIDAPAGQTPKNTPPYNGARTTAVTIATENFSSGTDTSLPVGWKAGTISGPGTWHWTRHASSSDYSLGLMNSTTASNGWMIFDADSFQTDCSCAPAGYLQSPAYNCASHPTVRLNFENYYAHVFDTCEIWVSTDSLFGTYTRYPVTRNNNLDFGEATPNDNIVHINITAAAAGHPAVYIRYVYLGDDFWDFSWMVDDMSLTELEPHDVGMAGAFNWVPQSTAFDGSIFTTPLVFVDSLYPSTYLSNYGSSVETGVPCTSGIYLGGTSVYSGTTSYPALPVNSEDSVVRFQGYLPADTGAYTCVYHNGLTTDLDHSNDFDTVKFSVTDTIWMQNSMTVSTNYSVYVNSFGPFASMLGARFDVPSGSVSDTVSGFGVAFSAFNPAPALASNVRVQLYKTHKGDTSWTYAGTSVARHITLADFSSDTVAKWVYFRIDTAGGVSQFVLEPGATYAAMIQTNHFATDLFVLASKAPKLPGAAKTFMIFDTSANDGGIGMHHSVNSSLLPDYIPFVRMYFGPVPVDNTGVEQVSPIAVAAPAYPDPANTHLHIPFTTAENADVTVTISDMTGRELAAQNVRALQGKQTTATFDTHALADGVYMYTIICKGQRLNGKAVIAH